MTAATPVRLLMMSFILLASGQALAEPRAEASELDALVKPAEREWLLAELSRVDPPERLRELSRYGARQLELGGGFYGMLPEQIPDPPGIPMPRDSQSRLDAALVLARQREANLAALRDMNPEYPLSFRGESLAGYLSGHPLDGPSADSTTNGVRLELDTAALRGFVTALADGAIDAEEAAALASLPGNRAMLEHRRSLGFIPEPLPDTESLATMIRMAGSKDPLDRLWRWINPQNDFGYADVAMNLSGYRAMLDELEASEELLTGSVSRRIAAYAPRGTKFTGRFAFTVGWAIRGWVVPRQAGLNLEQVKDDWHYLIGTLIEESYHQLQVELCPDPLGRRARKFSEITTASTGDARHDRLYEIIAYAVLEGAANRVREDLAHEDLPGKAHEGADLVADFVQRVVIEGDTESADALISAGLKGNGPLYGLGWKLADLIVEADGKRALGALLAEGPLRFWRRGAALADRRGENLLDPKVSRAVNDLSERMAALR